MATTEGQQTSTGAFRDSEVEEVLDKLDRELVGLQPVKTRIREIAALLLVDKLRKSMGLSSGPPSLHMSFTGNPGTGKTTVALRMAEILHRLGYIRRPEVISVTRDDLVGQYIGHTAPKTKEVLKKAMGGVLFIDEAYYLYKPENERDYGQESIEILLQVMENQRDDLVVILAGYKDRMDTFFSSNPGFASRVAHHLDFPDFAADELMQITHLMLEQQQYRFSPTAEQTFYDYVERRMQMPQFANARSIRNALDRARLRQANRLYAQGGTLTREQLMTIEAEDIMASRVFQEGMPDGLKEDAVAPDRATAEKKTLANTPRVEKPVAETPHTRRETTSEPHHAIQDRAMQTNMIANQSAQPNTPSADAGNAQEPEAAFSGMPHPQPPARAPSGWHKRTKRAHGARPAQLPVPVVRETPKVVNGRCEFGQCENEGEGVQQSAPPTTYMKPAPLPVPQPAQAPRSSTDAAPTSGPGESFGVPRELHAPRVVVRRVTAMRKNTARDRTPPAPPQINRPQPVVVNGRCEFGQCEVPSKVEEVSTTGGQTVTGTLVERSVKVTGNEPGSCKKITGTEYIGPDQYKALCAGDSQGRASVAGGRKPGAATPYVPPAKVGVTHTVGRAQRVTGTEVGPSSKVTGDEPGTCKRITGVEYLGAETLAQLCDSQAGLSVGRSQLPIPRDIGTSLSGTGGTTPGAPTPKTGVTPTPKPGVSRTAKNKAVTGTQVGTSSKVTGDELGSCKNITGDEYLNPATAEVPCADTQSPGPAKVNVSRTTHGRMVTGTLVGGSAKITGDEYGACHGITGTEYIGAELQKQLCGTEPAASPAKVGVARTWRDLPVSGTQVGRSEKVTGDEYGACKGVTGTSYIGMDSYQAFCAPAEQQDAAARAKTVRGTSGHAMTGLQPNVKGRMTGDARGACMSVTGTAYLGEDQYTQACSPGSSASAATVGSGAFSIVAPARAAQQQQSRLREITGTAYGNGSARITGPLAKSTGVVTGTAEFRHPTSPREGLASRERPNGFAQVQKSDAQGRAGVGSSQPPASSDTGHGAMTAATAEKSRITGEGTDARRITGDDWARNERVTGTEGNSSTTRNVTQRGEPRGVQANARRFREIEHPEAPPSRVTGSSGSAMSGSLITVSGGARG